jgi:hypothetical protein
MTETHRQNLLMACAYAEVFIRNADMEIRACQLVASSKLKDATPWPQARQRAAEQLQAALRALDDPSPDVPVVDWRTLRDTAKSVEDLRALGDEFRKERDSWT